MIYREGGCIDAVNDIVWVRLEYDGNQERTIVKIRDKPKGKQLAMNGLSGPGAKRYYDRLNIYFFGYDRKTDSGK